MVDYWESAVNVACQSNAENGYYDELDILEYQNRLKKYQQIKQDLDELTKYKRAFEILKKMNGINRTLFISAICDVATDEEIELLEELMMDE